MGATDPPTSALEDMAPSGLESNIAGGDVAGDGLVIAKGELAIATEAEVKELMERRGRECDDTETASQQSSRRNQQSPTSPEGESKTKKRDLLDKVETLTGEISESLMALSTKDKDSAVPEKHSRRPQDTAGPQSVYLKPSLSPISEDGPLDERGARDWEVPNSWDGRNDSPYTHGILLPDWQIWAEQVSQLLNRFSSEISILTSRVEWIDQRLRSPDSEVLVQGQGDEPQEDSAGLRSSKSEEELNASNSQQSVGGITAEIPSSPLVPLTPNLRLRADPSSPTGLGSAPRRSSEGVAMDLDLDLADKIEVAYVTCLRKHIPVPVCWTAVDAREREEARQEATATPALAESDRGNAAYLTSHSLQGSWEAVGGAPHVIITDALAAGREPSSARHARTEVLPEPPQLPAPRVLEREPLAQIRLANVASGPTNGATSTAAPSFPEPTFGSNAQTKAIPRTSGLASGHVSPCMTAQALAATKVAAVTAGIPPLLEQRPVVRLRLPAGSTAAAPNSARAIPHGFPNSASQVQGGQ